MLLRYFDRNTSCQESDDLDKSSKRNSPLFHATATPERSEHSGQGFRAHGQYRGLAHAHYCSLGFPTIFEYQTLEALCNCSGPDVTDCSLRLETRKSPLFSDHLTTSSVLLRTLHLVCAAWFVIESTFAEKQGLMEKMCLIG